MTYVNRSIHQRLWHSPLFETLSAAERGVMPLTSSRPLGNAGVPNITRRHRGLCCSQGGINDGSFISCRTCVPSPGTWSDIRQGDVRVSVRPRLLVMQGSVALPFLFMTPKSQHYEADMLSLPANAGGAA